MFLTEPCKPFRQNKVHQDQANSTKQCSKVVSSFRNYNRKGRLALSTHAQPFINPTQIGQNSCIVNAAKRIYIAKVE
jgi:hypothetical protein